MKNLNYIYTILFFLFFSFNGLNGQAQTITLNRDFTGRTYDVVARDLITLSPGFNYTSSPTTSFTARLDDKLICNVNYVTNPTPGTSRELLTSKEVGSIPGSYSVSPSGAATYSFPIDLPAGVNGLVPSIGISYSSQAGNNILGKGWNLSGISYITRGTKSLLQDGTINRVTLDNSSDRFFMNGNRLICISGTNGSSNSRYRTEIDNLDKIELLTDSADSKLYFNVQTADGTILKYSQKIESASKIVYWALKEVSDLNGNTITYNYTNSSNELTIDNITYSDTKVEFYYEKKVSDINFVYESGVKFPISKLLSKIKVTTNENIFREYQFTYKQGNSSLLYEISVSGGNGSEVNSTIIDWTDSNFLSNSQSLTGITAKPNYEYGDFNGDSRTDILTYSDNDTYFNVYINTNGTGSFTKYTITKPTNFKNITISDHDNDGDDDLLICTVERVVGLPPYAPGAEVDKIVYCFYYFTGSQFTRNTSKDINCSQLKQTIPVNPYLINADFNGDGEVDYLIYDKNNYNQLNCRFSIKGGNISTMPIVNDYTCIINFNGNQKTDLRVENNIYEFSNITNSFEVIYTSSVLGNKVYQIGDFNGDGLSDLIPTFVTSGISKMYYSTGNSFIEKDVPFTAANDPLIVNDIAFVGVTDFNNDGKSDIVRIYNTVSEYFEDNSGVQLLYANTYLNANAYISIGNHSFTYKGLFANSFINKRYLGGANPNNPITIDINTGLMNFVHFYSLISVPRYSIQDFNSDGNGDLLISISGVLKRISLVNGYKQELVNTITNGLNINTKFEYTTLYNSNVYSKSSSGVFPFKYILGPMYVVSSVNLYDNNSLNIARTNYKYKNAKVHAEYGFLGFEETSLLNTFTNILNTTLYSGIGELCTLQPIRITKKVNGGNNISTIILTNNVNAISVGISKYYQYRITKKLSTDNLTTTTVTTNYNSYNEYNQPTEIIESYSDAMTVKKNTTYSPFVSGNNWLPIRIGSVTVSKNRYGQTGTFSETTEFIYSDASHPHLLTSKTLRKNTDKEVTESYQYEDFGSIKNVTITDGANPRSSEYTYTSDHKFVNEKTINGIFPVKYSYNAIGQLIEQEDHNGNKTQYEYNGFGQIINTTLPNGNIVGNTTSFGSSDGPAGTIYYTQTKITDKGTSKEYYNRWGQLLRKENPGALNKTYKTDYEYNTNGLLYKQYMPYESSKTDFIQFSYDVYGRLTSQTTPKGTITNNYGTYGSKTIKVVSPEGFTQKTFDNAGLVTKVNDNGGEITYVYNNQGLTKNILYKPFGSDIRTSTTNEISGAIVDIDNAEPIDDGIPIDTIIVIDPEELPTLPQNYVINMDYDVAGNQIKIDDPNKGTNIMTYNSFGELLTYLDAKGNSYTMLYDSFGRMISKTCGSETTTWNYNTTSGALQSVSNADVTTAYTYDSKWLYLQNQTETIDGQNFVTGFTYKSNGDVATITYPGGFAIENVYDYNGFCTQVKRAGTSTVIWNLNNVNDKGMITNFSYGNEISTTLAYDAKYKPSEIVTSNDSINHWTYSFNDDGNLESRQNVNRSLQENFQYDNLNRLISYNGGIVSYLRNGNISTKADIGTYKYEAEQPNAVSNITSPNTNYNPVQANISYTSFDKVSEISDITNTYKQVLKYGPDLQRRIMKTYENNNLKQTKYYSGSYEKIVDTQKGTKQLTYIATGSGLTAVFIKDFDNTEKLYYIHSDYLGSIMALTNESGRKVKEYFYDAWGQRKNPANWSQNDTCTNLITDRGYTGHEHWNKFNLINMNGRVYDPALGRFLSADPTYQTVEYSQGFNKYSYVLNNPFKYIDPTGYNFKPNDWDGGVRYYTSFGSGISGASHYDASNNFSWGIINNLSHSQYGGTWNRNGQIHYFDNNIEAYGAGCAYNEYHNSWKNTYAKSERGSEQRFINILFASLNPNVTQSTGIPDISQYPQYASLDGDPLDGPEDYSYWEAFKFLWNIGTFGSGVPDNISIDLSLGSVVGRGGSATWSINLLTRGGAGLFLTRTEQERAGAEIDWGFNLNFGYYTGNPFDINVETLLGPVRSVSGGNGVYGINGSFGYADNSFGVPSWITIGTGVGITGGASYGWGNTYQGWKYVRGN